MLKRFVPQKPIPPVPEKSRYSGIEDDNHHPAKGEGEINSDGVLTIGENADIRGEIKTKSITVYGKVQGNITVAERCELKSRCTLQGDLKAARLVIEEGATFVGKSEVTSSTSSKSATSAA